MQASPCHLWEESWSLYNGSKGSRTRTEGTRKAALESLLFGLSWLETGSSDLHPPLLERNASWTPKTIRIDCSPFQRGCKVASGPSSSHLLTLPPCPAPSELMEDCQMGTPGRKASEPHLPLPLTVAISLPDVAVTTAEGCLLLPNQLTPPGLHKKWLEFILHDPYYACLSLD